MRRRSIEQARQMAKEHGLGQVAPIMTPEKPVKKKGWPKGKKRK